MNIALSWRVCKSQVFGGSVKDEGVSDKGFYKFSGWSKLRGMNVININNKLNGTSGNRIYGNSTYGSITANRAC